MELSATAVSYWLFHNITFARKTPFNVPCVALRLLVYFYHFVQSWKTVLTDRDRQTHTAITVTLAAQARTED